LFIPVCGGNIFCDIWAARIWNFLLISLALYQHRKKRKADGSSSAVPSKKSKEESEESKALRVCDFGFYTQDCQSDHQKCHFL